MKKVVKNVVKDFLQMKKVVKKDFLQMKKVVKNVVKMQKRIIKKKNQNKKKRIDIKKSENPIGGEERQEEQSEVENSRNWCGDDGYADHQSAAGVSEGPTNTPSSPPPPLPEVKTELEEFESTSPAEYASPGGVVAQAAIVRPQQLLKPKEEGGPRPWQRRTQKRASKQVQENPEGGQSSVAQSIMPKKTTRPEEETDDGDDDQLQKKIHEKKD